MWQSEQKEKDAFAAAWLREPDAFKAAVLIFGAGNAGRALQVSATWVNDKYVLERKAALIAENGEEHYLPSKFDAARKAWELIEVSRNMQDKIKALNEFNKIMGYHAEPEVSGKIGSGLIAVPMTAEQMKL